MLGPKDYEEIAELSDDYRRTGRGWQSRINAALRKAAKLPAVKRKKA